jgi:hypothetical protein
MLFVIGNRGRPLPSQDSPADGQCLTLTELGRARGISKASAARLVRRWRRQPGNDGHVRVLVPHDAADGPPDSLADMSRALGTLHDVTVTLREQLEQANSRAERAEQGRDGFLAKIDTLQAALAHAVAQAQAIQDWVEAARARGLLARFRAA